MTSKCTMSAPAASTASTSAPSFAKSAERIDGAIQGACIRRSLPLARRLYYLVRLDDLLRALLGVLEHRIGQAIGLELVRMMFAELAAVGLGHLLVRRLGIDLEDLVRRGELHAMRARGAGARTRACATGAAAGAHLFATNAQHRFHVRQLHARDVEELGHVLHGGTR